MPRARTIHRCTACGHTSPQWGGRCQECGEWNTMVEELDAPRQPGSATGRLGGGRAPAVFGFEQAPGGGPADASELALPLRSVDAAASVASPTGLDELDRVLGGGLVPGSVTLLGGEPGVGKSTLVLQVLASYASRGATSLLIAAEESAEQVRRRAERLKAAVDDCYVLATVDLDSVHAAAVQVEPSVLVVDSIQAVADPLCPSPAGSPSQVRERAERLVRLAKAKGIAMVLVGHVTKDGALAGPRALEHLVDTVLSFDGDRHHSLRLLSSSKHRYGSTGELGLFEMREDGLNAIVDPSASLLADRQRNVAGSVVVPILEGRRPILVEVQGLVGPPSAGAPRRVAQGVTPGRLALLLAVLERKCGVALAGSDVFVSAVGGLRATEPAADLGVALAVLSAFEGIQIPDDLVVIGEVGLAGELRQVAGMERRLAEAARLGFRRAIVPNSAPELAMSLSLLRSGTLLAAADLLRSMVAVAEPPRPSGPSAVPS